MSARKKLIWLAVLLIVITLAGALWSAANPGRIPSGTAAVGRMLMPLRRAVGGWFDTVERLYQSQYRYERILEENERLRIQIAAMEADARAARDVLEENERLQMMLGFKFRRPDLDFVMVDVVARDAPVWASVITVNAGSREGIAPDMAVIDAASFLVGIVIRVSENQADIRTVIDTDFRMPALVYRTGDEGSARGSFDLMRHGSLSLGFLQRGSGLRNGDTVLTAAAPGSMIPPGLVIGEVSDVQIELDGISEYAEIKPATDIPSLRQVFIIRGTVEG